MYKVVPPATGLIRAMRTIQKVEFRTPSDSYFQGWN